MGENVPLCSFALTSSVLFAESFASWLERLLWFRREKLLEAPLVILPPFPIGVLGAAGSRVPNWHQRLPAERTGQHRARDTRSNPGPENLGFRDLG
eukprot:7376910-Prymnesium_polylepis.1